MKKAILIFTWVVLLLILAVSFTNPARLLVFKMNNAPLNADGKTLAEELGYAPDTKLLVVNSDDTGGHPAFTDGVFEVMQSGIVKSTSVIVHDRNDEELKRIAEKATQHSNWGIGIHLTLTNEYQEEYPWAPVTPREEAPTLYNEKGLSWEKIEEVEKFVDPVHAAREFEAQILKAIEMGIKPTHIDSHMGTAYVNSQYPSAEEDALRMAAISVAEKFDLPMTVNTFDKKSAQSIRMMDNKGMIRPNVLFGFYELEDLNTHSSYQGSSIKRWITARVVKAAFGFDLPYQNFEKVEDDVKVRMEINQQAVLHLVKPGLNHFFMHAGQVSADGYQIPDGKNHEADVDRIVRLADAEVWSSDEMKRFLEDQNIVLINYTRLQEIQKDRNQSGN